MGSKMERENRIYGGPNTIKYRLGAIYLAYNKDKHNYRVGYNSEENIRGPIQNGFHNIAGVSHFRVLPQVGSFLWRLLHTKPFYSMLTKPNFWIAILLCFSCTKKVEELSMNKSSYHGSELRIDGYYYSELSSDNSVGVAVFYRDGVCIHLFLGISGTSDTLNFIEKEILLNRNLISSLWAEPTEVGVFEINGQALEFECWQAGRTIRPFKFNCSIRNDTTFYLKNVITDSEGSTIQYNLPYHFKKFEPKPDSTNTFIK
tara:strand:- start:379 stop:1155 length:777 start_codon:yes stop_codon:yes gene_type:complete